MAHQLGQCANWGKSATLQCARCNEGLDKSGSSSPTYYCGKECQSINFQDHKAICRLANARKQLYHATCFPSEENIVVKDEHKYIVRHFEDGSTDSVRAAHWVVLVGLGNDENDEHYVIDLAGAQYRRYRAVMPLGQFMERYVKQRCGEEDLGYYGIRWSKAAKYRDDARFPPDFDYSCVWVHNEIAKAVNDRIEAWEIENGKTVAAMLNQKQGLFETDKVAFLEVITTAIRDWIRQWGTNGKIIPPPEPSGEPQTLGDVLDQLEREARNRT